MKFDFVIGNPPYQESLMNTSDRPVYNYFMDSAFEIADKVELITPARFLFDAGKTPKDWNKKMLNDEHFKVLKFEKVSKNIFSNTDIKGGIAIHYRDANKNYGKIEVFSEYPELNEIRAKVEKKREKSFSTIIYSAETYKFNKIIYDAHPEILEMKIIKNNKEEPLISKGHEYDLVSNIFDKLKDIVFFSNKPNDKLEYIQIYGRIGTQRCYMWIRKDYINICENLNSYKVFVPKANGNGVFGETLVNPVVGKPLEGHTQTFISIGKCDNFFEANNILKYVKTKFCRTMLGILKVTQINQRPTWKYVPLQNFTENSDIDWNKSIHEIDLQLYKKYNLSNDEIKFIESHVKEMK